MRSKSRSLAVLGAVLALSAVTVTAAQAATEGPFYKVSGARLASGSTKVLKIKTASSFYHMEATAVGVTVICHKAALASSAKILGSSGANSSTSEETLELSECTAETSGGIHCTVENGKITSVALNGTLGYATATRTGKIVLLLKPASGTTFATIKFTGAEACAGWKTAALKGGLIGYFGAFATPLEVGINETQATTAGINYGSGAQITKIWTESAGALTEVKSGLNWEGTAFRVEGESKLELAAAPEWGIFT